MSTDTGQRVEPPPPVMGCIESLAADATLTAGQQLTGVLTLIYGWARYAQSSIEPTAIVQPRQQWLEICTQVAKGVPDDAIAGDELGLSFMNSGPSAHDERA